MAIKSNKPALRIESARERGFILISALWLLILCGAIAAVLMLRTLNATQQVAWSGEKLKQDATLDAAVDTVFASILMEGRRSRWAMVPTSGSVDIDGWTILLSLSSENGKVDANEMPLDKLDGVLQAFGVDAGSRQHLRGLLQRRRDAKEPLRSIDELTALFDLAGVETQCKCLDRDFTVFSGLGTPMIGQTSPELSKVLAEPNGGTTAAPQPIGAGVPLRIEASLSTGGRRRIVIARVTGLQGTPVSVSDFRNVSAR